MDRGATPAAAQTRRAWAASRRSERDPVAEHALRLTLPGRLQPLRLHSVHLTDVRRTAACQRCHRPPGCVDDSARSGSAHAPLATYLATSGALLLQKGLLRDRWR